MAEGSGVGTAAHDGTSPDVTPSSSTTADLHALALARLEACPAERLARLLGLRTGKAAHTLRAQEPAREHLAHRLAEGCADLPLAEADRLLSALLEGPSSTRSVCAPQDAQGGVRDG